MNDAQATMVSILAAQDAVWAPFRTWVFPAGPNVYHARGNFARVGVPWASCARSQAEARASHEALVQLSKSRIVKTTQQAGRQRTAFVRLSHGAEGDARRLVGLPDLFASIAVMLDLRSRSSRPATKMEHAWTPEIDLAGLKCWGDTTDPQKRRELVILEDMLLPALSRQWVCGHADSFGRVYYSLTRSGWAIVDAELPPILVEQADTEPDARELYLARVSEVQSALHFADPPPQEIGFLPLPVAHHGCGLGPWAPDAIAGADA